MLIIFVAIGGVDGRGREVCVLIEINNIHLTQISFIFLILRSKLLFFHVILLLFLIIRIIIFCYLEARFFKYIGVLPCIETILKCSEQKVTLWTGPLF